MVFTRKTGPLIVAAVDMAIPVVACLFMLVGLVMILIETAQTGFYDSAEMGISFRQLFGIVIIGLLCSAAKFYIGLTLWRGVVQEHYGSCRFWLVATAVFWVLNLFVYLSNKHFTVNLALNILVHIYQALTMIIVYQYMKGIRVNGDLEAKKKAVGGINGKDDGKSGGAWLEKV